MSNMTIERARRILASPDGESVVDVFEARQLVNGVVDDYERGERVARYAAQVRRTLHLDWNAGPKLTTVRNDTVDELRSRDAANQTARRGA